MVFALSTSWNAALSDNANQLLFEISRLGFRQIELSFNLTAETVRQLAGLIDKFNMQVVSLHNFCPIPDGWEPEAALPDCYSVASLDAPQRKMAVKYAKRTIDTAVRFGAKAIVLHCGRVEIADGSRQLINLYNQGARNSAKFIELRSDILRQRDRFVPGHLDAALKSLDELNIYAKEKNILIGVETRFYYREIPVLNEIKIILDKFKGSQIHYWHDTGHAQLMENLGLARHKDFLDLGRGRLIGAHLHDISGCRDHLAPGRGQLDFAILKPYLEADTLLVIEAHQPASCADLIKAREYLTGIFNAAA